ncbi:superoxide dismutase [Cyanobium sp. WAJ14-Wanaka]|uniref:superoxide dismutase n=1 Tax=Cyanobium sp. WAJ14-Wanaka TaxID=2823725 RepID=UPI0020CCA80C|nr:superoxide dismutase [Cyanobium sp. WAJ14-Wanaka]MCP9774313.1 superoxide dismutase [Cyanobium sp. WAJ14-Wanaka]
MVLAPLLLGAPEAAWAEYVLPPLPYQGEALEPQIDQKTMEIHHDRHHGAYVNNLNAQIATYPELEQLSVEELQGQIGRFNTAVRNNGGGHYNHSQFWLVMAPASTSTTAARASKPSKALSKAIDSAFGSLPAMQEQFNKEASSVFGSGWAWLIVKPDGGLAITTTANQDNPLMDLPGIERGKPLLGLDLWEHAYYLNYQNMRPKYISAWWDLVNWDEVNRRFS